jgi:copper chaperone NosL
MMRSAIVCVVVIIAGAACGPRTAVPAQLDSSHDACAYCRMIVSERRFASQIAVPLEEPRFFDDLGCLSNYVKTNAPLPPNAVVYVTDHSTQQWIRADQAVFTRLENLTTPMGSRIVAHGSVAARAADPVAKAGTAVTLADVLPGGLPGGSR